MERAKEDRGAQPCFREHAQVKKESDMATNKYYPEDILVQKVQTGEYDYLDFINHHSAEWQDEYEDYCLKRSLSISTESAEEFVHHKDKQLEEAMKRGDA